MTLIHFGSIGPPIVKYTIIIYNNNIILLYNTVIKYNVIYNIKYIIVIILYMIKHKEISYKVWEVTDSFVFVESV